MFYDILYITILIIYSLPVNKKAKDKEDSEYLPPSKSSSPIKSSFHSTKVLTYEEDSENDKDDEDDDDIELYVYFSLIL